MLTALLACGLGTSALAQGIAVSLQSSVFIERLGHTGDGRVERRIEPANKLRKGDRVVLVVAWRGESSAKSFSVTSAIPRTITYESVSDEAALVSVDGGKSFGTLGTLKIADRDGTRFASPQDVTHLRWRVSPSAARRGEGRMTYSAIVR